MNPTQHPVEGSKRAKSLCDLPRLSGVIEPEMAELKQYSESVNEAPEPADYTVRTEYSWPEFCRRCDLHLQKEADSKAIDMLIVIKLSHYR